MLRLVLQNLIFYPIVQVALFTMHDGIADMNVRGGGNASMGNT